MWQIRSFLDHFSLGFDSGCQIWPENMSDWPEKYGVFLCQLWEDWGISVAEDNVNLLQTSDVRLAVIDIDISSLSGHFTSSINNTRGLWRHSPTYYVVESECNTVTHGYQIWPQSGSDWPQMGQFREIFRSDSVHLAHRALWGQIW